LGVRAVKITTKASRQFQYHLWLFYCYILLFYLLLLLYLSIYLSIILVFKYYYFICGGFSGVPGFFVILLRGWLRVVGRPPEPLAPLWVVQLSTFCS
jgi:hypothetical protein